MSEKYGQCFPCEGYGKVRDLILLTWETCGRCGGTGFGGDAMEYVKRETEDSMQDAVDAINRASPGRK